MFANFWLVCLFFRVFCPMKMDDFQSRMAHGLSELGHVKSLVPLGISRRKLILFFALHSSFVY